MTVDSGRSYGGVSAEDRRAARRDRLVRAAIRVYGVCGYRQATVNAVCREAGLTPRYFYEAFENSDALLAAAFRAVTEFMIAEVTAAGDRIERLPIDKMRGMLCAYYGLLRREPAAARVFLLEITGVSPAIDALFEWSIETFADLVERTLASDPDAPNRVAPLLRDGATYGLMHIARSWIAGGYHETVDEVADAALPLCGVLAKGLPQRMG